MASEQKSTADDREALFTRIRKALQEPAPHPHVPAHGHQHDAPPGVPALGNLPGKAGPAASESSAVSFRRWLPHVGPTLQEQIDLFARNSAELITDFKPCASLAEAHEHIRELAMLNGWKKIATHKDPLAEPAARAAGIDLMVLERGYSPDELESCDAGVTGCDALIAQTGSILVTSLSAGGRALSVLPPHHIAIARREQMLPDLPAAYELLAAKYRERQPSFTGFITGPSRTGDIERILVLGAHGPKKLTVLLVP